MNQKEGVFAAVRAVFPEGVVPATGAWSKEQQNQVVALITQGFKSGQIEYKGGVPDDAKLAKYIPGLVNNWVRKDTRLNGGTKYETKRPGSRAGSGHEGIKNAKLLLARTTDQATRDLIQAAIDGMMAEVAEAKQPEIDVNALPESLRHLVAG